MQRSTVEFSKLESKDPKYDYERDALLKELGEKEDDFVMDTWLGAKFIPDSFKVFLDCNVDVRAKRIFDEVTKGKNAEISHERKGDKNYASTGEVKKAIKLKERLNRERWIKYYDFDFMDRDNYDVVIDTSRLTLEETVDKITLSLKKKGLL